METAGSCLDRLLPIILFIIGRANYDFRLLFQVVFVFLIQLRDFFTRIYSVKLCHIQVEEDKIK